MYERKYYNIRNGNAESVERQSSENMTKQSLRDGKSARKKESNNFNYGVNSQQNEFVFFLFCGGSHEHLPACIRR